MKDATELSQFSDAAIYAEAKRRDEARAEKAIAEQANVIHRKNPQWFEVVPDYSGDNSTTYEVAFYKYEEGGTGQKIRTEVGRWKEPDKDKLITVLRKYFPSVTVWEQYRFFRE